MNNNVNPILLRPFLEIVLAVDSVLLKLRQFMSWLQSGHHAVYPPPPPRGSYDVCKTIQECASDTESVTLLS